jgi:dolichyl-phosphate-mannose-protein mannosyltransferase
MRYEKALKRLFTLPSEEGRMVKKDWLILIILMLVYGITAYVNLGTTEVPATQFALDHSDQTVQIEFQKTENIKYIKYYAGLGEGTFSFDYSEDGDSFERVAMTEDRKKRQELDEDAIHHLPRDMYQWNFVDVDFSGRYVEMNIEKAGMKLNEVAFCTADGVPVKIASVKSADTTDEGSDPNVLFDEQQMVQVEHTTYLTDMYFDEVYHARTALENIEYIYPYEITHPPLGKIILGIGIRIFGMNPFGWRFMGTLFGILLIPVLYILAKRLFKNTLFAFIASFLFTFDFMHYTQTRIATIDSYSVFWIILMYYFMYRYVNMNFNRDGLKKTLLPLALCGLFFGLGAATKWLCIYAGLGLAFIFFFTMFRRHAEYKAALAVVNGEFILPEGPPYDMALCRKTVDTYKRNLLLTLLFCVLMFIIVPLAIYIASYTPYFLVKDRKYTLKDVWENQKYMLNYHGNLKTDNPHPFQSRWFTWPLDIRPVFFFQGEHMPKGYISNISTMGNPFVWWGGLAAVVFAIVTFLGRKKPQIMTLESGEILKRREKGIRGNVFGEGLGFVAIAALSEYLPWVLISRETFIYHYFATIPFLILILTYVLKYFYENFRHGKKIVYWYLAVVLAAFIAFFPILSGIVIPTGYANAIRWLQSWPFY